MNREPGASEPSPGALVRSSRQELHWLADSRLSTLEHREPTTALGVGLLSGGGGYLYTGDTQRGLLGLGAMITAIALASILPGSIAALPILGAAGWGGLGAWREARAINRYLRNRRLADASVAGHAPSQKLLASMPRRQAVAGAPSASDSESGEHAELVARLRKLASIRASGVIDENEHRARKIDLLSEAGAGLDAAETESLLYALLPLLDDGTLTEEDMHFVKELGS